MVDELLVFTAGIVIGAEGIAGIGNLGLDLLDDLPRLRLAEVTAIGPDVMSRWVSG